MIWTANISERNGLLWNLKLPGKATKTTNTGVELRSWNYPIFPYKWTDMVIFFKPSMVLEIWYLTFHLIVPLHRAQSKFLSSVLYNPFNILYEIQSTSALSPRFISEFLLDILLICSSSTLGCTGLPEGSPVFSISSFFWHHFIYFPFKCPFCNLSPPLSQNASSSFS